MKLDCQEAWDDLAEQKICATERKYAQMASLGIVGHAEFPGKSFPFYRRRITGAGQETKTQYIQRLDFLKFREETQSEKVARLALEAEAAMEKLRAAQQHTQNEADSASTSHGVMEGDSNALGNDASAPLTKKRKFEGACDAEL